MHEAAWLCGQKRTQLGVWWPMMPCEQEGGQWGSSIPLLSSRPTQATGLLSWESWHLFWLDGSRLVLDSNPHPAQCGGAGGVSVFWNPRGNRQNKCLMKTPEQKPGVKPFPAEESLGTILGYWAWRLWQTPFSIPPVTALWSVIIQ